MKCKVFRGSSRHWAYNHANVYCGITVYHQSMEVSVSLNISFLFCKTAADMNFKVFVEATIYEPIIMLMPFAWRRHQNKKSFVYLNGDCLCAFANLSLTWIFRFSQNQHVIYELLITWMLITYWHLQNKNIFLCLNVDCLCLFHNCWWHEIQSFCESNHTVFPLLSAPGAY